MRPKIWAIAIRIAPKITRKSTSLNSPGSSTQRWSRDFLTRTPTRRMALWTSQLPCRRRVFSPTTRPWYLRWTSKYTRRRITRETQSCMIFQGDIQPQSTLIRPYTLRLIWFRQVRVLSPKMVSSKSTFLKTQSWHINTTAPNTPS